MNRASGLVGRQTTTTVQWALSLRLPSADYGAQRLPGEGTPKTSLEGAGHPEDGSRDYDGKSHTGENRGKAWEEQRGLLEKKLVSLAND